MSATFTIYKRELAAYVRSPVGWVVAAAALLVQGILFQANALQGEKLSADVLRQFFWSMSGTTMFLAMILSIRLIAEERQTQSIVLLNTSPVSDAQIVVGKFLAAGTFLALILALSVYMPLMIKVNGKVTGAQIFVGYLGLWLLGASYLAIGMFASSLTRHQLVAGVLGTLFGGVMTLLYPLAKKLDEPFKGVLSQMDAWWGHYQGGFMVGVLTLENVVYYLALTYFFLLLTVKTMEAKRWH
jgi:ABC-2 type transport system permease protein